MNKNRKLLAQRLVLQAGCKSRYSAAVCWGLCAGALIHAQAAAGQAAAAGTEGQAETDIEASKAATEGAQVYEPSYFAQYGPRTALDMVEQIPGFTIRDGNQGQRGLGEANQNVLFNGKRASSKSDSLYDQLRRIPAKNVTRIEVLDGAAASIPGLSGQVVNVVYKAGTTSGQFKWQGSYRPYNAEPGYLGGEASLTGAQGALEYTVSLSNTNNRFGADGPSIIRNGEGEIIERRVSQSIGNSDLPKLAANITYGFSDDVTAHLNLSYAYNVFTLRVPETATPLNKPVRIRAYDERFTGPEYEIGGDIAFPLGAGSMKLIGINRYARNDFASTLIDRFSDGAPSTGNRYEQIGEPSERIGRFEYGWKMLGGDWQLSGEGAFNELKRRSRLFDLAASGQFVAVPYPQGTGTVKEDRYEGIVSFSRPLSSKLSLQITGGGEYSRIRQTGSAANSRSFQRPKGSLALNWKPKEGLDIALEASRKVNQLSFGAFLASVALNENNANGGNNELVPYQTWNLELEANKTLGPWGKATFIARQAWFQDFIDYFPLAGGGEARGNIGAAKRLHLQLNLTLKGEPIGWKGAQLDIQATKRKMAVTDPFTGETRGFSYDIWGELSVDFRHDIPNSDWAWGWGLYHADKENYYRRYEVGRDWEGPFFLSLSAENKDVYGMTVKAILGNTLGARNRFERTVYDGERPGAPIRFSESRDRRIGPIFRLSISGDF